MNKVTGYEPTFLGRRLKVTLPQPGDALKNDLAPVNGSRSAMLHYLHYSVVLSRRRKFPLFTAVNINSAAFRELRRDSLFAGGSDRWERDERARDFQWGD
ncbi:MAG TPA: hypothetical protein PK228_13110, partial [Saprospiraceae bacterium]|nr:hypothetical protein [Saprospiraceae bacterium]